MRSTAPRAGYIQYMELPIEEKIVDALLADLGNEQRTPSDLRARWTEIARGVLKNEALLSAETTKPGYYWAVYVEDNEVQNGVIRCIHAGWMRDNPQGPMIAADFDQQVHLLGPRVADWSPPEGLMEEIDQRLMDEADEEEEAEAEDDD